MGEDLKQAGISGEKEKEETFSNPDEKQKLLKNRELEETLGYRKECFCSAKRLAEVWVGFAILTSVCQFIKPGGWHLETNEYIALVVSALGTVVGLWWQVGKSMFPDHK
jgi:plasmid rolling circle replication initiator protein Rep